MNVYGGKPMRLEQFEYVIAVANTGSMHVASELLHTSQQNISKTIRQLESELQVKIFSRSNTGTRLTEDGEEIYRHAYKIMKEVTELKQNYLPISSYHKPLKGTLSIYASNSISEVITSFINPFHFLYPDINLALMEFDTSEILTKLSESNDMELLFLQLPIS